MNTTKSDSHRFQISRRGFLWRTLRASALCAALLCVTATLSAAPVGVGGKKGVDVYTVNVYIGADLAPALAVNPNDMEGLVAVTTAIYGQIVASDPETRMQALAADIAARQPDIVGGVELYKLELAPLTQAGPGQFVVTYDYLELLTEALADAGANYKVAVISQESQVVLPIMDIAHPPALFLGRLTDREAILVRSDLPPGQLWYNNPMTGQFQTRIVIENVLDLKRGWCSIDTFIRGDRVRVILSHLETEAVAQVQYAQAMELLAGPAATSIPVLLMGDFNTDPLRRDGTATYSLFTQAGFKDSWLELNKSIPEGGLTWGHDPLLANPNDPFETRIDLVLYRGAILMPTAAEPIDIVTGLASAPLWATDHKALEASFNIGNPQAFKAPAKMTKPALAPRGR